MDLTDLALESDTYIDSTGHNDIGCHPVSFKIRSEFYPIQSRGKDMDLYQKLAERDLSSLAKYSLNNRAENLSIEEKKSLDDLHTDPSIVVKNTDKGGMVVVLDAIAYKTEALRQLSDPKT